MTREPAGLNPAKLAEILGQLGKQPEPAAGAGTGTFHFPWGDFEYVSAAQLRAQFSEIFVNRQYAFEPAVAEPVIIDCGGNVGVSAVWFKLNYPGCQLTVYEPDPDLAAIAQRNLERAGFGGVCVRAEAVWIADGPVSFCKTGDDKGKIASEGKASYPAFDFTARLPEQVELIKLDVEGAEYPILDRLCETGAIARVRCVVCEFHVWRDKTDDLLRTLGKLRASGMNFSMNAFAGPWIGEAREESPFEVVKKNQVLMEVFAWRPIGAQT